MFTNKYEVLDIVGNHCEDVSLPVGDVDSHST